jgi:hypothetical protein
VKFQFSNHALRTLTEREILVEWVERTLETPELILPDRMTRQLNAVFGGFLNLAGERCESL